MRAEFFSDVKPDANLQNNVRQLIASSLQTVVGRRVRILIETIGKRSDKQNRYYWGCVVESQRAAFLERWGEIWDKDDVHCWNKANVWHTEIVDEKTGEIIKKPGSSKTKTKGEFEERLEKLRQKFWIDFEWKILLPNEQAAMALMG